MGVKDSDRGYSRLMKALAEASAIRMTIGIHAEEGSGAKEDGPSIVEVAEANEYGLGVPARPAITTFTQKDTDAKIKKAADHAATGLKNGTPIGQSLDQIAQVWAGDIQEIYSAGLSPPNAEATIKRKGSSRSFTSKRA